MPTMLKSATDDKGAGNAKVTRPEADPALWPALDTLLLPPDEGLGHLPIVLLDEHNEQAFFNGNAAKCHTESSAKLAPTDLCRVYDSSRRLAGLGEMGEPGVVSPRRVLQWS